MDCIAARESAALGCAPLTSSYAVFGDAAKDYCLKVGGDPREPATQRAAAARAIELLRALEPPCVDTATLRDETWRRVAARWLEVIRRLEGAEGP